MKDLHRIIFLVIEDEGFSVGRRVAMKILTDYRCQSFSSFSHICWDAADIEIGAGRKVEHTTYSFYAAVLQQPPSLNILSPAHLQKDLLSPVALRTTLPLAVQQAVRRSVHL